ncbi:hypothetical protein FBU30_008559 [Linnemannia zychae]|nr:hypothetical protein FBU30_008559 [Linnemannia zychae]
MEGRVIIDIPEREATEDEVMVLGVSGADQGESEIEAYVDEKSHLQETKYRSYFEVLEDNQLVHELTLKPVEEFQTPIAFKSDTNYLKWTLPVPAASKSGSKVKKQDHFDIVLGVSVKDLDFDAVEAIVITVHHNTEDSSVLKSEMITSEEFRRLCSKEDVRIDSKQDAGNLESPHCFRWKLHEKLVLLDQEKPTEFAMAVKTWQGEPAEYGVIELHYAELHTDARSYYEGGNPYFDTAIKGPMTVTGHTMSGDGSRILVTTVADNYRFLQLWSFKEPPPVVMKGSKYSLQSNYKKESFPKEPFRPQLLAWMQIPYADERSYERYLNWDGTQLVLNNMDRPDDDPEEVEIKRLTHKKTFLRKRRSKSNLSRKSSFTSFYQVDINYTATPMGAVAGSGFKRFEVDDEECPGLRDLCAKATFHIIATQNQNVEDELFVTCDGLTINVYKVFGEWSLVRSIKMDRPWSEPRFAITVFGSRLKQLRGSYLVLGNPDAYEVSTWNIEKGVHISSFMDLTYEQFEALRFSTTMSKDGRMIAIPGKHHVDIFWTTTWTRAASYTIHDMVHDPSMGAVKFIRNDTQLMVDFKTCASFCQRNHGSIFSTDSLAPVEQIITDGCDSLEIFADEVENLQAINVGFSQLSLYYLENRIFESSSRRKKHCIETCFAYDSYNYGYAEMLAPSGLTFRAEKSMVPVVAHGRRQDLPFVTVTVLDKNGVVCQKLPIPLPKDLDFNIHRVNFVGQGSYLVLALEGLVLIWSTPTSVQDKFTLRLAHTYTLATDWEVCIHSQLYGLLAHSETIDTSKSLDDPVRGTEADFLGGAGFLPEIFQNAGDELRDDILQYIGKHINLYIPGTDYDSNIVQYTCARWTIGTHRSTVLLWKVLLAHPIGRWIPRHDMVRETNPIWCLLSKTYEHPKAYELALVFIDYCIRQTKLEMDPHFLLPIRQCFQELTDPKKPYSDVTLELFRELAYIPARDRDFIIEHHWIAQPYKLRWRFWSPYTKGLHQYQDQVLQVTPTPTEHQPKYIFSRDIYLATYDMLWLKRGSDMSAASEDPEKSREGKLVFSWPYAIRSLIYRRMWPFHSLTVECHPFDRETLDNPALAALTRAIADVDMLAFLFPMIGSILELVWSDPQRQNSLFSFSVLFIGLHFLFELRVTRSVCKFVSIIIHAVASIRIFFFVFAGGILAFAVAFMHLLHTCTDSACASFTDGFSLNIFRIISMTYFMMGGRYDNLSGAFDSNDVGFHLMMAVFFFFTVILMLNVLIALINHAIDDGDRTWELDWLQNRMRYIESAENLTYDIPGYRAAYDFFPETIYYTATPLQAREYKKKTQRIIEETATTAEMSIVAEAKPHLFSSGDEGGHSWQDSVENNSDGTTSSDSNAALLKLMKQFHDEQQQSRLEQQRALEKFRRAHEEQQQAAEELRKELALLKAQLDR